MNYMAAVVVFTFVTQTCGMEELRPSSVKILEEMRRSFLNNSYEQLSTLVNNGNLPELKQQLEQGWPSLIATDKERMKILIQLAQANKNVLENRNQNKTDTDFYVSQRVFAIMLKTTLGVVLLTGAPLLFKEGFVSKTFDYLDGICLATACGYAGANYCLQAGNEIWTALNHNNHQETKKDTAAKIVAYLQEVQERNDKN